jgi:hypothetical protein
MIELSKIGTVIALIFFVITGCATQYKGTEMEVPQNRGVFVVKKIHSEDNEEATTALSYFLKDNSFRASRYGQTTLLVEYDGGKFILNPKMQEGDLSRIVVTKYYGVKTEYQGTTELLALALVLNNKFNIGQFSLSEDGDALILQGNITFVDSIDVIEIRKFLDYFNVLLSYGYDSIPEIQTMLK